MSIGARPATFTHTPLPRLREDELAVRPRRRGRTLGVEVDRSHGAATFRTAQYGQGRRRDKPRSAAVA